MREHADNLTSLVKTFCLSLLYLTYPTEIIVHACKTKLTPLVVHTLVAYLRCLRARFVYFDNIKRLYQCSQASERPTRVTRQSIDVKWKTLKDQQPIIVVLLRCNSMMNVIGTHVSAFLINY